MAVGVTAARAVFEGRAPSGACCLGEVFAWPTALFGTGLGGVLGMEVVPGGTRLEDAGVGLAALEEVVVFGPVAPLVVAGSFTAGREGRWDAVLEADGIGSGPFWRGSVTVALTSDPALAGAGFRVCMAAVCGFLEGIP